MAYDKTVWEDGDSVTPKDMNHIENGIKSVSDSASISYTKTVWKSGDVVSAEKLNNIENGIEKVSQIIDEGFDLQTKNVTYTPSEAQIQEKITKDNNYDFLNEVNVTVNAIPNNYIGTGIIRRTSDNVSIVKDPLSVTIPNGYYETSVSKELDLSSGLIRFIDYDGKILYEYSKDEFLALSSMPSNPDTSRFKPIVGSIITDPEADFFNGITNDEGKISFNVVEIESWRDYPKLVVDGIVFNDSTLNAFLDNMMDAVTFAYHDTVTITKNNKQYKLIVDWPADGGANKTGTLQILKQENLIPQGWNWSLSDAKTYIRQWDYLDIGQMYTTSNGDTEIDVYFPTNCTILSPYLGLAVNGEVDIDWGDNTASSTVPGSSLTTQVRTQHTYSQPGYYTIKITAKTNSTFAFFNSSNYPILNNNNSSLDYNKVYSACVCEVRIGDNCNIGNYAFQNCNSLKSITIPRGITGFGTYAFRYCYSLSAITIPDTVTLINQYDFFDCNSLSAVTIPNTVTTINGYSFYGCYSLSSITIPSSVTTFGENAFGACYSLDVKIIPELNLKYVNDFKSYTLNKDSIGILRGCSSVSSVTIPNTVTLIGEYEFENCNSLKSVSIPSTVTTIDDYAFQNCYSFKNVVIPIGVTSINSYAFNNCYSLKDLEIPDAVTSIGSNAFYNCYSLRSAIISNSITSLLSGVFRECRSLKSIIIPATVTSIGSYTFSNCYSLKSLTLNSGLTSIGSNAFYSCYSLSSITIPDTVTYIGSTAFGNCYGMKEYHFKSTTPPTLYNANTFNNIPSDCVLYVPQDNLEDYKTANYWSTYASQMEGE